MGGREKKEGGGRAEEGARRRVSEGVWRKEIVENYIGFLLDKSGGSGYGND